MAKIFISPFVNTTNEYIEIQKKYLSELNFEINPLNIRTIFSKQIAEIMSKKNYIAIHWLENRVFSDKKKFISIKGLAQFVIYSIVLKLTRATVIYFLHDHFVHDTTGFSKSFSAWLINALKKIADICVVHDPSAAASLRATYVPHPLYDDNLLDLKENSRKYDFGIIGAVRPYKKIDWVLEAWPSKLSLLIAGFGMESYLKLIQSIKNNRNLAKVDCKFRFLTTIELEDAFLSVRCIILAHHENSALVSGAFFAALGKSEFILARRSSFLTWAAGIFDNIFLFDSAEEFVEQLKNISNRPKQKLEENQRIKKLAQDNFGREACILEYAHIFQNRNAK